MAIDAVSLSPIVKLLDENIAAWLSMLYHLILLSNCKSQNFLENDTCDLEHHNIVSLELNFIILLYMICQILFVYFCNF